MPMRIVNLKGGSGGGGTVVTDPQGSGLFELKWFRKPCDALPNVNKFIPIYEKNIAVSKPLSITVLYWGMKQYNNSRDENHPPQAGLACGIKVFKGDDVPEKLYHWHGSSATYPYTYADNYYSGFNVEPSKNNAYELPTIAAQSSFNRTNSIAPDAINNSKGNWDFVANGGDGYYWRRGTMTDRDSPGSNGSVFGNGYTSSGTNPYPSSCGGPGEDNNRGPIARSITNEKALSSLRSLHAYAQEVLPPGPWEKTGGNGGVVFMTPTTTFGMSHGVPFDAKPIKIQYRGGPRPGDRKHYRPTEDTYGIFEILFQY